MIESNFFNNLFERCFLPYNFEFEGFKFWSTIFVDIELNKKSSYYFDRV